MKEYTKGSRMENNVDKEFCDERSGNIEESIQEIKKGLDKITWLIITTLLTVCSNLLVRVSEPCAQVIAQIKQLFIG